MAQVEALISEGRSELHRLLDHARALGINQECRLWVVMRLCAARRRPLFTAAAQSGS